MEGAISDITGGRLSMVVGTPDPERGQVVTAVLVGDAPIDEEALRTALKARLSSARVRLGARTTAEALKKAREFRLL